MWFLELFNKLDYQPIRQTYLTSYDFMEKNIEFWLPHSEWHTKSHCSRVLFLALLIGYQKKLTEEEMQSLAMAAVFHDSRRVDDGIDKGHGMRAAKYYKEYCEDHGLKFNESTYHIIYYHDQDDSLSLLNVANSSSLNERTTLLYQIFKDADALDRVRFGPYGLNKNYLRTEESKKLIGLAKEIYDRSNSIN